MEKARYGTRPDRANRQIDTPVRMIRSWKGHECGLEMWRVLADFPLEKGVVQLAHDEPEPCSAQ